MCLAVVGLAGPVAQAHWRGFPSAKGSRSLEGAAFHAKQRFRDQLIGGFLCSRIRAAS